MRVCESTLRLTFFHSRPGILLGYSSVPSNVESYCRFLPEGTSTDKTLTVFSVYLPCGFTRRPPPDRDAINTRSAFPPPAPRGYQPVSGWFCTGVVPVRLFPETVGVAPPFDRRLFPCGSLERFCQHGGIGLAGRTGETELPQQGKVDFLPGGVRMGLVKESRSPTPASRHNFRSPFSFFSTILCCF